MMSKKSTKNEFVQKAISIHGDKYNYSESNYVNAKTKIKIICPEHGIFEQTPNNHLKKSKIGCPSCAGNKIINSEYFITKSSQIHDDKYDYSIVDCKNNRTKVKIICPEHGIFEQRADHHMGGAGCILCAGTNKKTDKEFINKAIEIHGNLYDYSKVEYINSKTKITICCQSHGDFKQSPDKHLQAKGCPKCNSSKGELLIEKMLKNKNIEFIRQKKFKNCKRKLQLSFDFYLPKHNICIEYDGEQHFRPIKYFGGDENFKITQERDKIKNEYCHNNNIRLIRIKYNEDVKSRINFQLIQDII